MISCTDRKSCLLILPRMPYPPHSGGALRCMELVKILNKYYNVHLVVITNETVSNNSLEFVQQHSSSHKIFRLGKIRSLINLSSSVFNGHPFQVSYYYLKEVQSYVDSFKDKVDFAITNMVRTARYLEGFKQPVFFDIVDSYSISYEVAYKKTKSFIYKFIYKTEAGRLKKFEKDVIKRTSKTFFVNKFESDFWKNEGTTVWNPMGVNIPDAIRNQELESREYNKPFVAFLGKMDYRPNIDAMDWFTKHVLAKLDNNISLVVLGTSPRPELLEMAKTNPRIVVTGFVDNPYVILKKSLAIIAPMQTGSGIQTKILEGMSLEKVVISTTLASMPIIGAKNGEHLLVADDPSGMADLINNVYKQPERYQEIGKNARQLIDASFSWVHHENIIIKEIEEVIN